MADNAYKLPRTRPPHPGARPAPGQVALEALSPWHRRKRSRLFGIVRLPRIDGAAEGHRRGASTVSGRAGWPIRPSPGWSPARSPARPAVKALEAGRGARRARRGSMILTHWNVGGQATAPARNRWAAGPTANDDAGNRPGMGNDGGSRSSRWWSPTLSRRPARRRTGGLQRSTTCGRGDAQRHLRQPPA